MQHHRRTFAVLSILIVSGCADPPPSTLDEFASTSLKKGQGGIPGDANYCDNPQALCAFREGDCDLSTQCARGPNGTPGICTADNGGRYGSTQTNDHCAPASCS